MANERVAPDKMNSRGHRSSRWAPRQDVKDSAKKLRRANDKRVVKGD
jgi:hypothetical protein